MSLLTGLRFVQLGDGLAAAVCGRLFADVGAGILCIGADRSTPLAEYLNHGKTIVADDPAAVRDALATADLIVCEGGPAELRARAMGCRRASPRQCDGGARPHLALRPDRTPGGRSGDRSDPVLCQRHRPAADRTGGRSRRAADPAGRRAIRLYRRSRRRLRRHARGAGASSAAAIDVSIQEALATMAIAELARAGTTGNKPQAQARRRRQRGDGHHPAGARRLCGDLAARGRANGHRGWR